MTIAVPDSAASQGREGPEGLGGEAGELAVLDDGVAEPAPGAVGGADEAVGGGVEDGDLAVRAGR